MNFGLADEHRIAFEDVFVREDELLGDDGDSFKHAMSTLQFSRTGRAEGANEVQRDIIARELGL